MFILREILGLCRCVDEVCHSSCRSRGVIWESVANCCRPTLRNIPEERRAQIVCLVGKSAFYIFHYKIEFLTVPKLLVFELGMLKPRLYFSTAPSIRTAVISRNRPTEILWVEFSWSVYPNFVLKFMQPSITLNNWASLSLLINRLTHLQSTSEVETEWSCTSTSPLRLHGLYKTALPTD